jgi:hypothetical protein
MKLRTIKRLGIGGFGVVDLVQNEHGKLFARKTFNAPPAMEPRLAALNIAVSSVGPIFSTRRGPHCGQAGRRPEARMYLFSSGFGLRLRGSLPRC